MFSYNLAPLFWLALFGLVCTALVFIGGGVWAILFVIEHVRLV